MTFTKKQKVSSVLDVETSEAIDRETEELNRHKKKMALIYQEAKALREARGLKTNRITSYEVRLVLDYWCVRNRKYSIKNAFTHVYENTSHLHKEEDWVDSMMKSKFFGKELISALNTCKSGEASKVLGSRLFKIVQLNSKNRT